MTDHDKAIEAARKAVDAHYFELGFKLKPAHSRLAAQACTAAYLAALGEAGYVVVPVEPTQAMLEAGDMGLSNAGVDDSTTEDAAYCYRAMLAARPNVKG